MSTIPDDQTFADDEPAFAEADHQPFEEIADDDATPFDEEFEYADAAPVAPRTSPLWPRVLVGLALLVWLAVAWKALAMRNHENVAPTASHAPVASQMRAMPSMTSAPRKAVRHLDVPAKRRVANTREHPKRAPHHAAEPKRSVILGRGAVIEDDKSIIRIRD